MDLGIAGQTHIVLGGTRGMGRAAAELLAAEGARVAVLGRDPDRALEAAGEIGRRHGVDAVGCAVAANDEAAVADAVEAAVQALGPPAGLAAAAGPMGPVGDLLDLDDDAWYQHLEVQILLTARICRAVLPHLIDAGGGRIVTVAAHSVRSPKPHLTPYAAAKSGIVTLTKSIAKTYGDRGVRANCVCPGAIETHALAPVRAIARERYADVDGDPLYAFAEAEWGLTSGARRLGTPQEVAELIVFLLSERAAYLSGATVNIDGGTDF
ncbi:MAG: SDR family oxidoreductase [bacterium]|nr:SDR family oxidoreductase [bacterium]